MSNETTSALLPPDGTLVPPAMMDGDSYQHGYSAATLLAAVAQERERCAKLCEELEGPDNPPGDPNGYSCARAIRG